MPYGFAVADPAEGMRLVRFIEAVAAELREHAATLVHGAATVRWYGEGARAFQEKARFLASLMRLRASYVESLADDLRQIVAIIAHREQQ